MLSRATFPLAPELLGQAFVLFYVRSRLRLLFTSSLIGFELIVGVGALSPRTVPPGGGGYSHTLPIRVCAAQRGRDFEVPDLERGIHFRGVF